ncbi:MAG: hypothetical protein CL927_13855 [Deltaproteobacteria bacterium]|nr:hypothetical protein [Deltaproteobacteria bacterium]HCH61887.1 hypothetical protein [Deltaproteobacteria bacterium]
MWVLVSMFAAAFAASPQSLYVEGLDHARAGRPAEAADAYVSVLEAGGRDPAVYHGLGNALWRLDRQGPAMAAWRRGLRLEPRNGDIAANLERARRASRDHLQSPAPAADLYFWQGMLSPRDSGLLASLFFALALGIPVMRRFRRHAWTLRWDALLCAAVGILLALSTRAALVTDASVVLVVPEVSVRSAPGPDGVELFVLHEGAEVRLLETHREHHLVALPDARKGWVPAETTLSTDPSAPFPRLALVKGLGTP